MSENLRRKREEEDDTMTLDDILKSDAEVMEGVSALLGASDSSNCSYDKVIMILVTGNNNVANRIIIVCSCVVLSVRSVTISVTTDWIQ